MADAPGHNKQMPDGMIERYSLTRKEDDSDCVKQTARQQPDQASDWNERDERFYGDDAYPAHHQIKHHGNNLESIDVDDIEYYPEQRKRPYQPE